MTGGPGPFPGSAGLWPAPLRRRVSRLFLGPRLSPTLAVLLAFGCAGGPTEAGPPVPTPLPSGAHEFALSHDGRARYYLVHIPPAAAAGEPLPLVLALHGGGGNPEQFREDAGFEPVADREGFIVVFPAGTGIFPRTLLTWNAGTHCCGFALNQDVDDVGFLEALIDDLARRTPVERRRVYAAGHSNGAMMSYRLAAEGAGKVAAILPVAGGMMLAGFDPPRPTPLLHIHSIDDPRALYEGGLGPPFPLGGNQVLHRPTMEGIGSWAAENGCASTPTIVATLEGAPGSANDGHAAELLSWEPCASGAPVRHWRLTGVGHGWPGTIPPPAREELIGGSTTLLSAPEVGWDFFRDHALP